MSSLAAWVFVTMIAALPPSWLPRMQNDVSRLRELVMVAIASADAAEAEPLPHKTVHETASVLIQVGLLESGFSIKAIGKRGELGPWQLMPPAPTHLRAQAKEALRRWRVQGAIGYTGEAGAKTHPLADHRELGAAMLAAAFGP